MAFEQAELYSPKSTGCFFTSISFSAMDLETSGLPLGVFKLQLHLLSLDPAFGIDLILGNLVRVLFDLPKFGIRPRQGKGDAEFRAILREEVRG